MRWFKVWSEVRNDGKLRSLPEADRWVWLCLLSIASEQSERGRVAGLTRVVAIEACNGDVQRLVTICNEFETIGLVTVTTCDEKNIDIEFPAFTRRQASSPSDDPSRVRERVQRHRQKHVTKSPPETSCNGNVTGGNDKQKQKQKQIQNKYIAAAATHARERKPEPKPEPAQGREPDDLPYPDPETSPHHIHTGAHPVDETAARKIFATLWHTWKSRRVCMGYYEHQRWYTADEWRRGIAEASRRDVTPTTIGFIERIAGDPKAGAVKPAPRASPSAIPPRVKTPEEEEYFQGQLDKLIKHHDRTQGTRRRADGSNN